MKIQTKSLSDINQEAITFLCQQMGTKCGPLSVGGDETDTTFCPPSMEELNDFTITVFIINEL